MTSNKIYVNLSRPKTAEVGGRSSKNIVERTRPELITTNISSASNDNKMIHTGRNKKK